MGIDSNILLSTKGRFAWMPTLYRLAHYQPELLIASDGPMEFYHIMAAGTTHYQAFWATYRQTYPK